MNQEAYMYQGAYMYYENNKHNLLIYGKLPHNILMNAMPLTYKADNGNYITTIFIDGKDYIGQSKYENIYEMINKDNVVDIINNDYDEVKKILPELTKEEYNENLEFSKRQLAYISKEQPEYISKEQTNDNIYYLVSAITTAFVLYCIYYRYNK